MSKKSNQSSTVNVETPLNNFTQDQADLNFLSKEANENLIWSYGVFQKGSFWYYREIISDKNTKEVYSITDSEPDIRVLIVEQVKMKLAKSFQG